MRLHRDSVLPAARLSRHKPTLCCAPGLNGGLAGLAVYPFFGDRSEGGGGSPQPSFTGPSTSTAFGGPRPPGRPLADQAFTDAYVAECWPLA